MMRTDEKQLVEGEITCLDAQEEKNKRIAYKFDVELHVQDMARMEKSLIPSTTWLWQDLIPLYHIIPHENSIERQFWALEKEIKESHEALSESVVFIEYSAGLMLPGGVVGLLSRIESRFYTAQRTL